ncbi:MAG: hypothetical protein ACKVZJ_05530 [Phycisphaerales bacterium]
MDSRETPRSRCLARLLLGAVIAAGTHWLVTAAAGSWSMNQGLSIGLAVAYVVTVLVLILLLQTVLWAVRWQTAGRFAQRVVVRADELEIVDDRGTTVRAGWDSVDCTRSMTLCVPGEVPIKLPPSSRLHWALDEAAHVHGLQAAQFQPVTTRGVVVRLLLFSLFPGVVTWAASVSIPHAAVSPGHAAALGAVIASFGTAGVGLVLYGNRMSRRRFSRAARFDE